MVSKPLNGLNGTKFGCYVALSVFNHLLYTASAERNPGATVRAPAENAFVNEFPCAQLLAKTLVAAAAEVSDEFVPALYCRVSNQGGIT